jgi:hypothetical protein
MNVYQNTRRQNFFIGSKRSTPKHDNDNPFHKKTYIIFMIKCLNNLSVLCVNAKTNRFKPYRSEE